MSVYVYVCIVLLLAHDLKIIVLALYSAIINLLSKLLNYGPTSKNWEWVFQIVTVKRLLQLTGVFMRQ